MAQNPEIAEHLVQLQEARARGERLLDQLDDQSVNWRPAPDQWSVAQCLDHLNITAEKYLGTMTDVVAEAKRQGPHGAAPGKRRLLARFFIWSLEPPSRLKAKAPQPFAPGQEFQIDDMRQAHAQARDRLQELIEAADGVALDQVKVVSPVTDKIHFRVGEAFAVILAHERRHLAQAERVLSEMKK